MKASNEVGWSVLEPVQINCRTAERPHKPRHLSCADVGAMLRLCSGRFSPPDQLGSACLPEKSRNAFITSRLKVNSMREDDENL